MSPNRNRTAGFVLAVVGALVLVSRAPAWAAPELRLEPAAGQPGDSFTVTGTGFEPGPVDIHWDSESGPHLTTTVGPEFTVTVVVPADAQPNSYPVVAVVRNGNSLSTSTASFQVGPIAEPEEPEEPREPTTTTVAESPPATDPPPVGRGASTGGASRDALGVTGGVDPDMAGTTNGGSTGQAAAGSGSGAGSGAGSDAATTNAAEGAPGEPGSTTTTTPPPAGGPPGSILGALPPSGAAGEVSDGDQGEAEGAALAPRSTSQSSGAVQSPVLLVLGLGMVFGGGVVLAVRNRHRAGA